MDILEIMNIPYYKKGSTIHIKKENRGKFTRSAKEHNMGVLEFATHVLNNKDEYNPTLVKRANFAKNSKKFKHAKGGLIKKCQNGEIIGNQPISYDAWKKWQEMLPEYQKSLEDLAILQYADNKAKYGDDVPEEAKYLYSMGLLPEVEVIGSKYLTPEEKKYAKKQWEQYIQNIEYGSDSYKKLPKYWKSKIFGKYNLQKGFQNTKNIGEYIINPIINPLDAIDNSLHYIAGLIPGGDSAEIALENNRRKLKAGSGGSYIDVYNNLHTNPIYLNTPQVSTSVNYNDLYNMVRNSTKFINNKTTDDVLKFRLAINSDDRFLAGIKLREFFDNNSKYDDFIGHGIAKGTELDKFASLRTILRYGINPNKNFYQNPLKSSRIAGLGTSSGTPYYDGSFVLLSHKENPLNFTHVLVNDSFENLLGYNLAKQYLKSLQKEFPNIKTLLYSELYK